MTQATMRKNNKMDVIFKATSEVAPKGYKVEIYTSRTVSDMFYIGLVQESTGKTVDMISNLSIDGDTNEADCLVRNAIQEIKKGFFNRIIEKDTLCQN